MALIAEVPRLTRVVGDYTQEATITQTGKWKIFVQADLPDYVLQDPDTDLKIGLYQRVNLEWRHVTSIEYKGVPTATPGAQPAFQINVNADANTQIQLRLSVRGKETRCGATMDAQQVLSV